MLRGLALDDLLEVLESGGSLADSQHPLRATEVRAPHALCLVAFCRHLQADLSLVAPAVSLCLGLALTLASPTYACKLAFQNRQPRNRLHLVHRLPLGMHSICGDIVVSAVRSAWSSTRSCDPGRRTLRPRTRRWRWPGLPAPRSQSR